MEPFQHDIPALACQSARAWASQALDDELSRLEEAALEAHLTDCAACDHYVASMQAVTVALRSAPPVAPERRWAGIAPRPAARGLHRPRVAMAAAAAAIVAAVGLGSGIGTVTRNNGGAQPSASGPGGFAATQQPYREQTLLALLPRLHQKPSRVVAV